MDTIHFRLDRYKTCWRDFLSDVPPTLDSDSVGVYTRNDSVSVKGALGNLLVSVNEGRVSVKGSLCKWHLGDNYQAMTRKDVQRAIEHLSDVLHLPMDEAQVTRIDFGICIPVKEPVTNYFSHMGQLPYAVRKEMPTSLYYHRESKGEVLVFYDKNKEARDNKVSIPEIYRDCNVLRYEQRFLKRLPQQLKEPQITGSLLYDERFYSKLWDSWKDGFKAIRKINDLEPNFEFMKDVQSLNRLAIVCLMERFGGENNFLQRIKNAQKASILTPTQATRLKQAVERATDERHEYAVQSESMEELTKKIEQASKYRR